MMFSRRIKPKLLQALANFPAVALVGPRQVGKTTLARNIAADQPGAVYLDLERPSDLAKLDEPEIFLEAVADRLVIIDEVQRRPKLFPLLRALIDDNRRNGRFLLLGSAAPDLITHGSETLAGRIAFLELAPLTLDEVKPSFNALPQLWLKGGFPPSVLANSDSDSFEWREQFIRTHLERDIPTLGIRIPAANLRRFWQMVAHSHGQLWNASQLAAGFGVSPPTIQRYLDVLEDTFMVRQLRPYHVNLGKRLVKSPKIYLRDSGLLHCLLGIETVQALQGHPIVGPSWEGWVIEQLLALLPSGWRPYFYRTAAGAEVDLLIDRPGRKPLAIEIKFSSAPKPGRGFWSALADTQAQGWVCAPVTEGYPLAQGVNVLPVTELHRVLED